uniref:Variable lymphocyte receptor B n=1 Tax=Mordacia mordax TaxID=7755 RepID=A0A8K1T076_MORMR|nr:variable lymphocyte receptor B [Mordacia mordax]
MWIKLIASLVAFGALIQSGLGCPSQCSYPCSGTNKPVRSITAAASDLKYCGPATTKPTTTTPTTTTPTTTTPEMTPTTRPVPTTTTKAVPFNCSAIEQRSNVGGDCGKPACHTLMNCANFLSCLCASCALCKKR